MSEAFGLPEVFLQLLNAVPSEHRGIGFERISGNDDSFNDHRKLEKAFAVVWAKRNRKDGRHLLPSLLYGASADPREDYVPCTDREWEVACCAVATVVQWLGTPQGLLFLEDVFRESGGKLAYTLPPKR